MARRVCKLADARMPAGPFLPGSPRAGRVVRSALSLILLAALHLMPSALWAAPRPQEDAAHTRPTPETRANGGRHSGDAAPQEEPAESQKQKKGKKDSRYRELPPQFPLPAWWAQVLQQPRKVSLGAGLAVRPRFPGTSDVKLGPILFFDVEIKRKYFVNVTDGIGMYFYRRDKGRNFWSPYFELKASLAPGFESRSAKEFPGLEPVGKTMLARLAGTVGYGPLALDAAVNTDAIGQGHEGTFITLALQGKLRAFGQTLISLGPEARFGGSDYMSAFYGVDFQGSESTGLPPFDLGSGFERVGARLQVAYPVAPHWTLFSLLRYEELVGKARRSPVTSDTNRVTFVLALGYRF